MNSRAAALLQQALRQSLSQAGVLPEDVAVAVSGGPDSAMLAATLARLCAHDGRRPHILHIHHGLQAAADGWSDQVHHLGLILGLPCHSQWVQVDQGSGKGVEAAARDARYLALAGMLKALGLRHLLLAHHRDDQAETVLLRLLRGSGPAGLAGMAPRAEREGCILLRPWLDVARIDILQAMQEFTLKTGWLAVHDPTNYEDAYTRSALRERLAPALDQRWPAWQANLARHARLAAQWQTVLDETAAADLQSLEPDGTGHSFSLARWRQLSAARQALVLRHWLAVNGQRAPSQARLDELMRQMRGLHALGHDRAMRLRHDQVWISCRRGRVVLDVIPAGAGSDSKKPLK